MTTLSVSDICSGFAKCKHNPHSPKIGEYNAKQFNDYKASMTRKAQTHSAKNFKFVLSPPKKEEEAKQPKKNYNKKKGKNISTKDMIIIKNLYEKIISPFIQNIILIKNSLNFSDFCTKQQEILNYFLRLSEEKRKSSIEAAKFSAAKKLSLVAILAETERAFLLHSCPSSRNVNLFALLDIPSDTELVSPINYQTQLDCVTSTNRNLGLEYDPRCVGFEPTKLQRAILDKLDENVNIIVRAPTGSGKTMVSLYLAEKMKANGKITVYLAPNKPICGEMSLFVHNHGFAFAIAHGDFISFAELERASVWICTPNTFTDILFSRLPQVEEIGAIIFDELPYMLHDDARTLAPLLLLAQARNWHAMALSATFADDLVTLLKQAFERIELIEELSSIRPVDLILKSYDATLNEIVTIPTSSTYPKGLLSCENKEEQLRTAVRVPLCLDEFKHLMQQTDEPHLPEVIEKSLPKETVFTGIDMVKFALHLRSKQEAPKSETKETDTITGEMLYTFLNKLREQDLLPVMFFHSNPNSLNNYHALIWKQYKKQMEELTNKKENVKTPKKRNPRAPEIKEKQEASNNEFDYNYEVPPKFGFVDDSALSCIFKTNPTASPDYRFGIRGKQFLQSPIATPIRHGIGIYHPLIDIASRLVVESSLRLGFMGVVFCDASLAFGVNLPCKSVVFLCDNTFDSNNYSSNELIQASGRAGRWGLDQYGSIFLLGKPDNISNFWRPLRPVNNISFPFPDVDSFFRFCYGSESLRCSMNYLISCKSVPMWNWTPSAIASNFGAIINILADTGIIVSTSNFSLTHAGGVAAKLHRSAVKTNWLFVGYLFSKYKKNLSTLVKSKADYKFLTSHFICTSNYSQSLGPTLEQAIRSSAISPDLINFMKTARAEFINILPMGIPLPASVDTTAFFYNFPASKPNISLYLAKSLYLDYISVLFLTHSACNVEYHKIISDEFYAKYPKTPLTTQKFHNSP